MQSPLCVTKLQRAFLGSTKSHPRILTCTLVTVLLAVSSACVFVWDVGISFGRLIPVMSGIELLVSQSEPGVCRCSTLAFQTMLISWGPGQVGLAVMPVNIDLSSSILMLNWWTTGCGHFGEDHHPDFRSISARSAEELLEIGCGLTQTSYSVWIDS